MGWYGCTRAKGQSNDEFFLEEALCKGPDIFDTILDSSTVDSVWYAAIQRDYATGERAGQSEVWCMVNLIKWYRGPDNFYYKPLEETMGPTESGCPDRILDLLPLLPDCHHKETYCVNCNAKIRLDGKRWVSDREEGQREEVAGPNCYTGYRMDAVKDASGKPLHAPGGTASCSICWAREWRERCRQTNRLKAVKLQPGTVITFAAPLKFSNGEEVQRFVAGEKANLFRGYDARGRQYRIKGWREMEYSVGGES